MFPLHVWCASESRLRSLFFVEVGAAIIVESTIVLFFRISPFAVSCSTTCEKSFSCSSFFTNRFLNLPSVSPSGIWLLDSTPQKSENALLSVTSATVNYTDSVSGRVSALIPGRMAYFRVLLCNSTALSLLSIRSTELVPVTVRPPGSINLSAYSYFYYNIFVLLCNRFVY